MDAALTLGDVPGYQRLLSGPSEAFRSSAFESIHSHLAERMEANAPSESRWLSREVKMVDGTCLSMPDTPENQAAYPQPSNQKKGCGFPMIKLVGLFSLKSGALLHFARGTLRVHESQLFPQLWAHLCQGDIVLGDRAFCSFFAMASLLGRGVE